MKTAITLHHTADGSLDAQYDRVWQYHNSSAGGKWPKGHGIQYHWFVEKSGLVKQGGAEGTVRWHSGVWYWNLNSIAVCLAGDFTQESPTEEQILALTKLVTGIQNRWGIPDDRIFLHREHKKTECPGIDLRVLLFTKRASLLKMRIIQLTNALKHAKGPRRTLIERLLQRFS
jgi:hypothetical protein